MHERVIVSQSSEIALIRASTMLEAQSISLLPLELAASHQPHNDILAQLRVTHNQSWVSIRLTIIESCIVLSQYNFMGRVHYSSHTLVGAGRLFA
jgi:hypothetical protein